CLVRSSATHVVSNRSFTQYWNSMTQIDDKVSDWNRSRDGFANDWRVDQDVDAADAADAADEHAGEEGAALDDESLLPNSFIEWFVVAQTAIPAMLYLPGSQAIRLPIRIGAYATALFGFAYWWLGRGGTNAERHPAERWL